jgi:hypothetical protein
MLGAESSVQWLEVHILAQAGAYIVWRDELDRECSSNVLC